MKSVNIITELIQRGCVAWEVTEGYIGIAASHIPYIVALLTMIGHSTDPRAAIFILPCFLPPIFAGSFKFRHVDN